MWDINLTTSQIEFLQKKTFLGKEVKSLAYIVGTMNMILHGIEAPRIIHSNTLSENVMQIQEKDRFDVILANPPFGGSERPEVQQNFAIRSGETAYLFLQHFIRSLKAGGRAAIVIKNTFLSNSDAIALRRELLETCDLHTILDCPAGTFSGTGVKTVVLFFEKGRSTQSTWFYELSPGRSLGKRNPLNDVDLAEFVNFSIEKTESVNSWHVKTSSLDKETLELSVQNPNRVQVHDVRQPTEILERIEQLEAETRDVLKSIGELL
jgi:type I restriction enzyme M protein